LAGYASRELAAPGDDGTAVGAVERDEVQAVAVAVQRNRDRLRRERRGELNVERRGLRGEARADEAAALRRLDRRVHSGPRRVHEPVEQYARDRRRARRGLDLVGER